MSGEAAPYESVTCNVDFYYNFSKESYDIVNSFSYFLFYMGYQAIGLWGFLFTDALAVANILKYSYLGFQQVYSAQGVNLYKNQQIMDYFFNFGINWGIGPDFGALNCWTFEFIYGLFHWAHAAFFNTTWTFWFIDEE